MRGRQVQFRRRNIVLGTILLLAVAALAWKCVRDPRAAYDRASAIGTGGSTKPEDPGAAAGSTGANPANAAPLPPLHTPLAAIFDDLKRRADRGDARASCRLAVELIDCGQLESLAQAGYLENSKSAEKDLEHSGMLAAANSVANHQVRHLESMKRCAGIGRDQRELAADYLLQAANAGIPEAMIRYAEGQGIATGNSMFGALRSRGFDQWRRNAVDLLQNALERGEPAAVFVLYSAHSDDNSLIGGLIADDPVKVHTYRLLMGRLRGKSDAPAGKLSPRQKAEADQHAAEMHAEYFNSRILDDPGAFSSSMTPAWARPGGPAPRRPCE